MWLCLDIYQDRIGGTFARMYIFVHFFYSHIDLSASLAWASVWWNFRCCDLICHSCYSDTEQMGFTCATCPTVLKWPPCRDRERTYFEPGIFSSAPKTFILAPMKDRKWMSGMKTHIACFFNSQLWMTGAVINGGGVRGAALVSSLVPVFSQVMRHPNKVGWPLCIQLRIGDCAL